MKRFGVRSVLRFMPLSLAVVLSLLAVSCGRLGGEKTLRVSVFVGDPQIQYLRQATAEFERIHRGWKVRLEYTPYSSYQDKIMTQVAGSNAPDLMMLEVNNFVDLYLRGFLEDLTPYAQAGGLDLQGYYPGVLNRFSPGGHLVVLPQDTAPMGLVYYNRKAFREAGVPYPKSDWTWPEPFLSICKKLVKRDAQGKIERWAYCESFVTNCTNFIFTSGGDFVDDVDHPTRVTLDSPEALKGYRFYWDMMRLYHVTPSPSDLQGFGVGDSAENMFLNGKLAMMDSGLWHTPKFLQDKDLDFDIVPFPAGPGGKKGWGTGGSGFAVAKTCKEKIMAWELAKLLCGNSVVMSLAQTGWIMPAKRPLAESDAFLKSPGPPSKALMVRMPEYAHYEPMVAGWPEMYYGLIYSALDKAWSGEQKPEEVLPAAVAAVNRKYFGK